MQSYVAAALALETPGRISDFGIPFPNWRVLLSRHQLGATLLTVGGRGFSGKDNQFRELPIKTGMAVGGDNQISVEISPCSVEITYYHPTAGSS